MQFQIDTAFLPFVFETFNESDHRASAVLCRGAFTTVNSRKHQLSDRYKGIAPADQYRDQLTSSSIRVDTDLVPHKSCADITLNSVAYSPDGGPHREWAVSVHVGRVSKLLDKTGSQE